MNMGITGPDGPKRQVTAFRNNAFGRFGLLQWYFLAKPPYVEQGKRSGFMLVQHVVILYPL